MMTLETERLYLRGMTIMTRCTRCLRTAISCSTIPIPLMRAGSGAGSREIVNGMPGTDMICKENDNDKRTND